MKKTFLNILAVSSIITTIGFIMDGDPKVPSMLLRFTEFFLMLATITLIISAIYFGTLFIINKFKKNNLRNKGNCI